MKRNGELGVGWGGGSGETTSEGGGTVGGSDADWETDDDNDDGGYDNDARLNGENLLLFLYLFYFEFMNYFVITTNHYCIFSFQRIEGRRDECM